MPSNFPAPELPDVGLPSAEQLQRMANAMFAALPGASSAPAVPGADAPQLTGAIPMSLPGGMPAGFTSPSIPTDFGSAPRLPTSVPAGSVPAATPSAGGAPLAGDFTTPAYYFLEEARRTQIVPAVPASSAPKEFQPKLEGLPFGQANFDVNSVRRDFPILQERVGGKPLIWLDNAATTQKPQAVIDRVAEFYRRENSNIHRGAHELAARATDAYEKARDLTAKFLNAPSSQNIVFVRGATEAINLVAKTWGRQHVGEGDEVLITWLEHHANVVPWQQLCAEKNAKLRVAPVDDSGQVMLDEYQRLLGPRTRLVSFPQVSNALGTVTPAKQMVEMAHRFGAKVLVDGAQAVSHMRADVQSLDCDWYVFSGHKVFAPTGIGVLYGKSDVLEASPPWQGGGNMIQDVTFEKTVYHKPPARFEAGTGNIADAVGLGAAIEYLSGIGIENVSRYEHELLEYATTGLESVPGLKLIGTAPEKAGVLSFVLSGFRTEEVGSALSREGIAVRAGHHCAQPILRRFGVESTVRPSLALYNTCAEIDSLVEALLRLRQARKSVAY